MSGTLPFPNSPESRDSKVKSTSSLSHNRRVKRVKAKKATRKQRWGKRGQEASVHANLNQLTVEQSIRYGYLIRQHVIDSKPYYFMFGTY